MGVGWQGHVKSGGYQTDGKQTDEIGILPNR